MMRIKNALDHAISLFSSTDFIRAGLFKTAVIYKKNRKIAFVLMSFGLFFANFAQAAPSVYTGTLLKAVAQPSPTAPNTQTRFGIVTSSNVTTACSTANTYSFDLSNAGLASTYEAIVIASLTANIPVTITGTGTCDAYGIEMVGYIYLN